MSVVNLLRGEGNLAMSLLRTLTIISEDSPYSPPTESTVTKVIDPYKSVNKIWRYTTKRTAV